jgi:hypothetical protein
MAHTFDTTVPGTPTRLVGADGLDSHLKLDDVFHTLQNERRRFALVYLSGRDGPVKMRDLAEQVAAWEHDTTIPSLDSDERQRVYISLYQSHLPKLDDIGAVRYRQSRGLVERRSLADEFEPFLDSETDGEAAEAPRMAPVTLGPHWVTYAVAVVVASVLVTAAAWMGLFGATAAGVTLAAAFNAGLIALFVAGLVLTHR